MNWYYTVKGNHTHVRVFMNGAKCGDLVFRNEEFSKLRSEVRHNSALADSVPTIVILADDGYNDEAAKLHTPRHD